MDAGDKPLELETKPSEAEYKPPETGDKSPETGEKLLETGDKPPEPEDKSQEPESIQPPKTEVKQPQDTGASLPEARNKPLETGLKPLETGHKPLETENKPLETEDKLQREPDEHEEEDDMVAWDGEMEELLEWCLGRRHSEVSPKKLLFPKRRRRVPRPPPDAFVHAIEASLPQLYRAPTPTDDAPPKAEVSSSRRQSFSSKEAKRCWSRTGTKMASLRAFQRGSVSADALPAAAKEDKFAGLAFKPVSLRTSQRGSISADILPTLPDDGPDAKAATTNTDDSTPTPTPSQTDPSKAPA